MKKTARKISIISLKGGVGKTTTTIQLASALADKKAKVLVIDFDPSQGNTTSSLIGPIWNQDIRPKGICSAIIDGTPLDEVIYKTSRENLFIIPSERKDSKGRPYSVETAVSTMDPMTGMSALSSMIEKSSINEMFDFVIIDTGPTNSMIVIAALNASDYFMVPVQLQDFSIDSVEGTIEAAIKVKRLNPKLQALGFFVSSLDKRQAEAKDKIAQLESFSKQNNIYFFKAKIPVSAKFGFLPSKMKTIFDVTKKTDRGHKEYLELTTEVLTRIMNLDKAQNESARRSQGVEV